MSIKTILISQPEPTNENSPYSSLIRKHKVKIDFRKFIWEYDQHFENALI